MSGRAARVTVQEAADRTGLSTKTIRRMIARGDLKAYRVGNVRAIRIDVADLERRDRVVSNALGGDA